MDNLVSLIDKDVVIVKTTSALTRDQLDKNEKELTEKLNKKVVILPYGLDICNYKEDIEKNIDNVYKGVRVSISKGWEEVAKAMKGHIEKQQIHKKHKLLNKEEYLKLKMDIAKKMHEEQWDRISKGHKYVVVDSDDYKNFYSLDYFYDKPMLGCNIYK